MNHLRVQDEGLEAGSICVKSMIKTMSMTLSLQTRKVLLFLQLHPQGKAPDAEKEKLRPADNYSSGHKKISSTEKYRQSGLEELKATIDVRNEL